MRDLTIPAERHPEKANKPDNAQPSKPSWIRVKAPVSEGYKKTRDREQGDRGATSSQLDSDRRGQVLIT